MTDSEMQILQEATGNIWEIGEGFGLDPFPTHFEVVPSQVMYEFGAYGLPGRFSHWSFGKQFHQMKTMYDYGLSKIYELVVNTDPAYAFLMDNNSVIQNTMVIAHVMGHCDFFKRNIYFGHTCRQMIELVRVHADRIRKYEFDHGQQEVERLLDAVLAIQEHIDPAFRIRCHGEKPVPVGAGVPTTDYDDLLYLREKPTAPEPPKKGLPNEPVKDILAFVMQHAPYLEDWQRDVISIVREEMYYFLPQMQTKIMNEGWASLWHARIMRELDLTMGEQIEFAQLHSGVVGPGGRRQINPYYVGIKIWEDIERRWDNPSEEERRALGRKGGEGKAKIFEVAELENDVSFLRNYLTEDLVEELDLYIYDREGNDWVIVEKDWRKVRDALVDSMTNFGIPYIVVEDGDYNRNRELYLKHRYEGREMDMPYSEKALQHVYLLWGRPVHLETVVEGKTVTLTYDGKTTATEVRP
ncbi:MAG: SpoVR family protein [Armatimonadetes bacterium]|nr:SpoVR family protein [Armatimonadota bacterium]